MAYYSVEPWPEERSDIRAGIIAAATANFSGRLRSALKPSEFIPKWWDAAKRKVMSTQDMKAVWASLKAIVNRKRS